MKSWLVTTAERELWRLWRQQTRHQSLSADEDEHGELRRWDVGDEHDHAAIRLRLREALQAFARLPKRRRDIKALQVARFSYEEIAEMRGLTWTRVNHVLAEANAALREHQVCAPSVPEWSWRRERGASTSSSRTRRCGCGAR